MAIAGMKCCCTYVVETTVGVTVGDDLEGRVHAARNVQTRRNHNIAQAEAIRSTLLDSRHKVNVERVGAVARVVTKSYVDLRARLGVLHVKLNWSTSDRPQCATLGAGIVEATAGSVDGPLFVETASDRPEDLKVGGGERGEEREESEFGIHRESVA